MLNTEQPLFVGIRGDSECITLHRVCAKSKERIGHPERVMIRQPFRTLDFKDGYWIDRDTGDRFEVEHGHQ